MRPSTHHRARERESADTIVREFARLGYRTKTGSIYAKPVICHMLRSPIYAAKQEHQGKLYDAGWEPIRTWETHQKIQRLMDRKTGGGTAGRPSRGTTSTSSRASCGAASAGTRWPPSPPPAVTRFSVAARVRDDVIAADERSDGMFPLITNCRDLPLKQILEAYKFQPKLEKRHEQLKSVQDLAPVWLKNVSRIEALLFVYFVALLVHALLERELRAAMGREKIEQLPLYPEERLCRAPTTERVLDVFAPLQRHRLFRKGRLVQIFEPELTQLQRQILQLLDISASAFQLTR